MHPRWAPLTIAALSVFSQSGCGVVFQTVYGWNTEVERESTRTYPVAVTSEPPGALITRLDQDGPLALGPSPVDDQVGLPVQETVRIPSTTWPLLIGGIIDAVIALGAARGLSINARRPDDDSRGRAALFAELLIGSAAGAFAELVFAGIYANLDETVVRHRPLESERRVSYLAERGGFKGMMSSVRVPWQDRVRLSLVKVGTSTVPLRIPGLPAAEEPGGPRFSTTATVSP